MHILYIPSYMYYLWLSLRSRSLFFFTASNPGIENGGMLGESKFKVLSKIQNKPKTFLFNPETAIEKIEKELIDLEYPLIAKPDIGERGWGVKKINNSLELQNYLEWVPVPFILQEYIDLPLEVGVFFHRFPGEEGGRITSIVFKEMLSVTGDGHRSLRQLIMKQGRAILQLPKLEKSFEGRMEEILPANEKVELVGIGNHALGTKFIDATDLVDYEMVQSFNKIADGIDGFYYGRFDLRCQSLSDLKKGNVSIMELNGAGAEPAHIYEPGYSFFEGQRTLIRHLSILFKISRMNRKRGISYMSFKEGRKEINKIRKYNKAFRNE